MAEKILIVDDDYELRSELRDFLDGYDVIEASSGEEALDILKVANEISLVILDVMMPGISGLDVLTELKKTDPTISIIILTGHSSKDVAIEALKSHADDYIEKPLNISRIKESIERLLGKRRGEVEISAMGLKDKLAKVKSFIERNCYKKITLKEAAESVCLSPKYLSRIFKEQLKTGFSDYKLALKIEKAKELLDKSGYNINQISEKLGYENAESFIRQFKKLTRKTPTEYRKKTPKRSKKRKVKAARKRRVKR
jgi:two-component system, response regulator YesN